MIKEHKKQDFSIILEVINDAAIKYKGVIPYDCWHYPYMSKKELINEFNDGVHMFGYHLNEKLIGVIGIQNLKDVTLIRHAYILTSFQGKGIGRKLIKFLLKKNQNSRLLVGTWKDATWAIKFYQKFGFTVKSSDEKNILLKKYWKIPLKQKENSVVLERYKSL